jgi:hypothetical protein
VTINGIICHINSSGFIIEKKQKWVLSLDWRQVQFLTIIWQMVSSKIRNMNDSYGLLNGKCLVSTQWVSKNPVAPHCYTTMLLKFFTSNCESIVRQKPLTMQFNVRYIPSRLDLSAQDIVKTHDLLMRETWMLKHKREWI